MKEYVTLLVENNLLEYQQGNITYRTTEGDCVYFKYTIR